MQVTAPHQTRRQHRDPREDRQGRGGIRLRLYEAQADSRPRRLRVYHLHRTHNAIRSYTPIFKLLIEQIDTRTVHTVKVEIATRLVKRFSTAVCSQD